MELLYLRIFDTNTIHDLSFTNRDINFKPEHNFYYDEKNDKIKYTTNESYNKNLYGANTRVTGLIGGNGVGKSTLLKFLQYLIAKLENRENRHSYTFDFWSWETIINTADGLKHGQNLILDIEELEGSRQGNTFEIHQISFKDCKIPYCINSPSSSLFYSPHLDFEEPNFDNPDYINVSSDFIIYHESRNKEDNDQNVSQIVDFRRNEIKRQISFMQFAELEENEDIQFYKTFNRETISVSFNQFVKKFDSDPRYIDFKDVKVYNEIDKQFVSYSSILNNNIKKENGATSAELASLWLYKRLFEIIYYNAEYRGEKEIDDKNYRLSITEEYEIIENNISENLKSFFVKQLLIDSTKLSLLLVELYEYLESDLSYEYNDSSFVCSLDVAKKLMKIENEIISLLPFESKLPLFVFDWQGMSTGEKAYLNLFSRIHYGLKLLDRHLIIKNSKKVYFLIDEPATGFHPQWQKEYLNKLLSFLNVRFKGEKHLIISSHSPFLVSDLQKEDVVALSKDSQDNFSKENTFGANIQDLLADNFFLQNGFIGDFSKNKIDELVRVLTNKEEISQLETINIQKLISIIGEPLIKDRLQEIYDERFKSQKEIEKEIERLQRLLKDKLNEKN